MAHLIDPMPDATREETGAGVFLEDRLNSTKLDRFDREEQECLELAFNIAITDPTEEECLRGGVAPLAAAWRRLWAALGELLKASLAVAAALAGRLLLATVARVVRRNRPNTRHPLSHAQLSVWTLHALLGGPSGSPRRRLTGKRTALLVILMLGGRHRKDSDGHKTVSLKAASRAYRAGLTTVASATPRKQWKPTQPTPRPCASCSG